MASWRPKPGSFNIKIKLKKVSCDWSLAWERIQMNCRYKGCVFQDIVQVHGLIPDSLVFVWSFCCHTCKYSSQYSAIQISTFKCKFTWVKIRHHVFWTLAWCRLVLDSTFGAGPICPYISCGELLHRFWQNFMWMLCHWKPPHILNTFLQLVVINDMDELLR
jgi:hypothetical protein